MTGKISIITIIFVLIMLKGTASAVFLENQSFNNLERSLNGSIGDQGAGGEGQVNRFFHMVTRHAFVAKYAKFGIAFALILTLWQFINRDEAGRNFVAYMVLLFLFIAPVFGGKAFIIYVADLSDQLTMEMMQDQVMGAPDPKSSGSGAWAMVSFKNAVGKTFGDNNGDLAKFKNNCYKNAVQAYHDHGFSDTPPPSSDKLNYVSITVDPGIANDLMAVAGIPPANCAGLQTLLQSRLKSKYDELVGKYHDAMINQNQNTQFQYTQEAQTQFNNMKNVTAAELLDQGVQQSSTEGGKSTWQKLKEATGEGRGEGLYWTIVSSLPKIILTVTGETFLWIFDYYIYDIVSAIKTVAAMAMALGILYFLFLRDPRIPLGALGVWVMSNGLYIIAGFAIKGIYYQMVEVDASTMSSVGWLLGYDTIYGKAMIVLAFVGMTAFPLAGLLSWKGVSGGLNMVNSSLGFSWKSFKGKGGGGGSKGKG